MALTPDLKTEAMDKSWWPTPTSFGRYAPGVRQQEQAQGIGSFTQFEGAEASAQAADIEPGAFMAAAASLGELAQMFISPYTEQFEATTDFRAQHETVPGFDTGGSPLE
ncbi:hypothetical protein LCGC14_3018910, partial [marine sediment metagenome]